MSDDREIPDRYTIPKPTGRLLPHIVLWLVQLLAFTTPNFSGRRALFATGLVVSFVWTQLNPYVFENLGQAQPLSIEWSNTLSSLEKLLFSHPSPEACLYRVDRPVAEATAMETFSLAKLRWAIVILINMRGIRWNYQVKNVPPVKYRRRGQWLRQQVFNVVYYAFMADLTGSLSRRLFYTNIDGSLGRMDVTMLHPYARVRFIKTLVFGATPYYMLSYQYTLMGLVAVVLHISKPEDWPAHFGRLKDAWTVREFWGKYWHQTLRKPLTAFSRALVDTLGIKRGTNLSSYTQLWFIFLFSGFMHAAGNRAMPRPLHITTEELFYGWIIFFVWQAAAITWEDLVQYVWRQSGGSSGNDSRVVRIVGYSWVTWNLWTSLPFISESTLGMRMLEAPLVPVSVFEHLMHYIPIY